MSWADDIRCLYCDGRLPLYRKITNGQFCSAAHRKAYWQEQERLAVERLHQTHDSLYAYKPRESVEAILGPEPPAVEIEARPLENDPHVVGYKGEERPAWLVAANSGNVAMAGFVRDSGIIKPRWLADCIASELLPMGATIALRTPFGDPALGHPRDPRSAGLVVLPRFAPAAVAFRILAPTTAPTAFTILAIRRIGWIADPVTLELEYREVFAPAPLCESLLALSRFATHALGLWRCEYEPAVAEMVIRARLPLRAMLLQANLPSSGRVSIGLRSLPVDSAARTPALPPSILEVKSNAEPSVLNLGTPCAGPALAMARGCRYVIEPSGAVSLAGTPTRLPESGALSVVLPLREAKVLRGGSSSAAGAGAGSTEVPSPVASLDAVQRVQQPARDFEPAAAGPRKLEFSMDPVEWRGIRPAPPAFLAPQPPRPEPRRPRAKLEPLPFSAPAASAPAIPAIDPLRNANVWTHTADFWHRAPRDLKTLAFAIPLLLSLALHPSLPKVRVAAPESASGFRRNFETAVNEHWANFRQSVFDRAAVALDEDFRSGLDDWASRGDATATWSFDATGFVRPGPLALYRPTMGLTDYELQFLGMIDKKALSWVVRAADFDNYYVIKLEVVKPGPVPTIGITRYAVVNGKADARADVIAPIDARNDMLYRVRMEVHSDEFALMIQDQMVDAWSEPRLSHGGVGFFSAQGEDSRLRWVQVTHQYDMLGRLCAYLTPYNNLAYDNPPGSGNSEQ